MANSRGKKITLFLMDGNPNGRLFCELSNWTGKAYKIPRDYIKTSSDRSELMGTGVYFLFGETETKREAYIGEAENIYTRLNQHLTTKENWTEALVFISKDENLNKAHIKYLENRLFGLATEASRFALSNGNTPNRPSISEADRAEMEEFIENMIMLTSVLGYKLFEPSKPISQPVQQSIFSSPELVQTDFQPTNKDAFVGYIWKGQKVICKNQKHIYKSILERFVQVNPNFLSDFYECPEQQKSKKRRFLAKSAEDLYLKSSDLANEHSNYFMLQSWFVDVNLSRSQKQNRIEIGCKLVGIEWGKDLEICW